MTTRSRTPLLALALVLAAGCTQKKSAQGTPATDDGGFVNPDGGDGGGAAVDGGDDAGTPDAGPPDAGDGGVARVEVHVHAVVPSKGSTAGGETALVVGSGFANGLDGADGGVDVNTAIAFGGNPVITYQVIDDTRIEVTVPPGLAGPADVSVTNPNGADTCRASGAACYRYFTALTLSAIAPAAGLTTGGDAVAIRGTGFTPDTTALVGGRALIGATVTVDASGAGTISGATPPAAQAGAVDVVVYNKDGVATLRRAFLYHDAVDVSAVTPPASALAGGVAVTLTGRGFSDNATVTLGGVAATGVQLVDDRHLTATVPAASAAGPVDVTVTDLYGTATLAGGFVYIDDSHAFVALAGAVPSHQRTTGGRCADAVPACLSLVGTGLSASDLQVSVGGQPTTIAAVHSDQWIDVDVPAGAAGKADVQARSAAKGASALTGAVTYYVPLVIGGATPSSGPAAIPTPPLSVTVNGSGFTTDTQVFVGANALGSAQAAADGSSVTGTLPAGSPGAADLRAQRTLPDGFVVRAALPGGFAYTAPLSLAQVTPSTGSQSGGNLVTIFGTGFGPGMTVAFAGNAATVTQVTSTQVITVQVPHGNPGLADVSATSGAQHDLLHGGYSYYDPTSLLGGASGGPLRGTLNVTVLDGTNGSPLYGQPVAGCNVSINADELTGTTDDRGQASFTAGSLVKAVTVTVSHDKYATASVERLFARDLTIFLSMNDGKPASPMQPPPPPPAFVSGHVYGFKTPAGVTLSSTQHLEARVSASTPSLYYTRPFDLINPYAGDPFFEKVGADGGAYKLQVRYGGQAIYAVLGIVDSTSSTGEFTPILMGIARGVQGTPGMTTDPVDLILDMHRDVTAPVQILSLPTNPSGVVQHQCFATLDLGGEGVIPLQSVVTSMAAFDLPNLPRVSGDALFIVDAAGLANPKGLQPPYSFDLRRQQGDITAGVTVGPMVAFPLEVLPGAGAFDGTIAWSLAGGPTPDLAQVNLSEVAGLGLKDMWDVVLPGTETSALMPPSTLSALPSGQTYLWQVIIARTPRFQFDHFSYQQVFGVNTWTSFALNGGVFTTP